MAASSSLPRLLVLLLLVAVTLVVADPATASARNERRNVTAALPASTNDAQWTVTITDPFPSVAAYIPLAADDVSISPAYTIINADTHYNAFCWYPISVSPQPPMKIN